MDSIKEGDVIILTLVVMLQSSWAAIAAAPRHRYVPPIEYEQVEFGS